MKVEDNEIFQASTKDSLERLLLDANNKKIVNRRKHNTKLN